MRLSQVLRGSCLLALPIVMGALAFGQFPHLPKFPGSKRDKTEAPDSRRGGRSGDDGAQVHAAGVPVPADSPIFSAFEQLQKQAVYHQRMTILVNDPRMEQIMAQMGFAPAETTTAGDTKQVSMHFKMPVHGQAEDFELRAVTRNGRLAKKWISPASGRILKEQDASIAKQLAESEEHAATSIAKNISMGPMGLASAGVSAAAAAANVAEAGRIRKQAHDFFEWSCMDAPAQKAAAQRREPPPLTDLRVVGDQTLDGVAVTSYEFFVHEGGKFQGPLQMHVAKETGLPMRISMTDPRAGGSMQMDYYGFNQGGDIEIPPCFTEGK